MAIAFFILSFAIVTVSVCFLAVKITECIIRIPRTAQSIFMFFVITTTIAILATALYYNDNEDHNIHFYVTDESNKTHFNNIGALAQATVNAIISRGSNEPKTAVL